MAILLFRIRKVALPDDGALIRGDELTAWAVRSMNSRLQELNVDLFHGIMQFESGMHAAPVSLGAQSSLLQRWSCCPATLPSSLPCSTIPVKSATQAVHQEEWTKHKRR